ncbi:hypothetical protein [Streptomyces sp. NPDC007984]|uniref:hypothetical protein n=1 Tax=Streptomyces sp. NPDC007984 TaxID=3364801 RepID=UPI0036E14A0E
MEQLFRRRTQRLGIGLAAAVGAALVSVAVAGPASASESGTAGPTVAARSGSSEASHPSGTVRPLTLAEVTSRGLTRFVDTENYHAAKPQLRTSGAESATRTENAAASASASGCWSHDFKSHTVDQLHGTGHVDWCGNGTGVTYASSSCSGYEAPWMPTYQYLSCATSPAYGVGYNVYDLRVNWDLCGIYVPLWGACTTHARPMSHYRYDANGGVHLIAQTGA